ncbi:MAG: NAD(P)/FAD-dependent oxidoreductase, partial [Candidatus Altiarchaeota archaeon]|nr:NAD(P)/FAD-dependent oxidoreductase [Candidatus Altiarchaeota archaeon]
MREEHVDVVVVGAGPAGSVAALKLAEKGLKVLVLEKRQEIGAPKRCAEGISYEQLVKMEIKPNPKWAPQKIIGTILYTPKMKEVNVTLPGIMGYVLERKVFEKHLATMAINAGARYMVKTMVTDVIKEGNKVVGVTANHMGDEWKVFSKVVVAADGVDSMTAKKAGIDTLNHLRDYHSGFQYEMGGVKCDEER